MWAWPEHCLPCQSFLDIPVQLDMLEAKAAIVLRCPQEESFCDLIFSTAGGSVVQKSSRLSHPTPNLVRYPVLNTHTHNTLSEAHTHTYTFSYTRSPCSPELSDPWLGQRLNTLRGTGGGAPVFTPDSTLPSQRRTVLTPLQTLPASVIQLT